MHSMLDLLHHSITIHVDLRSTDLIPLTLAIVALEQTLVVRDAVLAEDEPIARNQKSAILNRMSSSSWVDIHQLSNGAAQAKVQSPRSHWN